MAPGAGDDDDKVSTAEEEAGARREAQIARDEAKDAQADAHRASSEAQQARNEAESLASELLISPLPEPATSSAKRPGRQRRPMSRTPFYTGFVGGLGLLAALLIGLALKELASVFVVIIVSAFLAVGLNPIVELIIKRGVRRRIAVLIVILALLGVIALFVYALVPVIRDQIAALISNAPGWLQSLRHNPTIQHLDAKYGLIGRLNAKLHDPTLAQNVFGSVFSVGVAVVSAVLNMFLVFVLTIYFLSTLPTVKRACYSLVPASRRGRVTYLGDEILRKVGGYVVGAFVVAFCAGLSSFVFLEIVGLSAYALALALLVMLTDFIPLVGATIGAGIVTIIGLANSPGIGIACLVFYICYQQVENYVIYPRVMASSVNVPGVVTVIAVLIGGSLLGIVGALIAIPMAAAVLLLLNEIVLPRQDRA